METALQRIAAYIARKGITESAFLKKCGLSATVFSRARSRNVDLSKDTIRKICETYSDIDRKWLQGELMIDRLEKFMVYNKLNNNRLTIECGLTNGLIGAARKKRGNLNSANIDKILSRYPEINKDWLLYGIGSSIYDDVEVFQCQRLSVEKDPKKYSGDNVIRLFRKVNDIKQCDLADFLQYNASSLSQIESGLHSIPSWVIAKLRSNDKGWDYSMLPEVVEAVKEFSVDGQSMSLYLSTLLRDNMQFRLSILSQEELELTLFLDLLNIKMPSMQLIIFAKTFIKHWGKESLLSDIWKDSQEFEKEWKKAAEEFVLKNDIAVSRDNNDDITGNSSL